MKDRREASDREHFDAIAEQYGAKDLAPSCRPARQHRLKRTIAAVPGDSNHGKGVHFEASSIEDFNPSTGFDLIFMIGVVHHLENAGRSLRRIIQWLEPGGFLVANEPSPENPLVHATRVVRERIDRTYSSDQEEISADRFRSLLEGAGLRDVTVTPQGFASTPFAEVVVRPFVIAGPLARAACIVDRVIEKPSWSWLKALSWNLIGCGRAPTAPAG
jgi:SAM-dependent methyltransferase